MGSTEVEEFKAKLRADGLTRQEWCNQQKPKLKVSTLNPFLCGLTKIHPAIITYLGKPALCSGEEANAILGNWRSK